MSIRTMKCIFLCFIFVGALTLRKNEACNTNPSTEEKHQTTINDGIRISENDGNDCDLLIAGSGSETVSTLFEFSKIKPTKYYRITVVEKRSTFGPGSPYDGRELTDDHVMNIPAQAIDITTICRPICSPSDFVDWLTKRPESKKKEYDVETDDYLQFKTPPKRSTVGEYLAKQFEKFAKACNDSGYHVHTIRAEAVRITRTTTGYEVALTNHPPVRTTDVFFATGHFDIKKFKAKIKGFSNSPWPAADLKTDIGDAKTVGVLGTSLSGGDTALTVADKFGKFHYDADKGRWMYTLADPSEGFVINMYSRSGHLPAVSGVLTAPIKPEHMTDTHITNLKISNKGFVPVDDLIGFMKTELLLNYKQGLDAQHPNFNKADVLFMTADAFLAHVENTLYSGASPVGRLEKDMERARWSINKMKPLVIQNFFFGARMFLNLNAKNFGAEDVIKYKKRYASRLFKFAIPMPLSTAEKLHLLIKQGHLFLKQLQGECDFETDEHETKVWLECEKSDGTTYEIEEPHFVDARGQSGTIEKNPSPLVQSLLKLVKTRCLRFRTEKGLEDALAGKQKGSVKNVDGVHCFEGDGVEIDAKNMRAKQFHPPAHKGVIYVSGPFVYGYFPIAQNLFMVILEAQRVVADIAERHFGIVI